MEPILLADEELDLLWFDPIAAPVGRERYVIGESLVAYVVADAFLEKFGGDSITEIKRNLEGYLKQIHA